MPRSYLAEKEESYRAKNLCGQFLKIAKEQKITQQALADELGYSQGRISQKIKEGDLDLIELLKVIKLLKKNVVFDAEGKIVIYDKGVKKDGFNSSNTLVINPLSGNLRNS